MSEIVGIEACCGSSVVETSQYSKSISDAQRKASADSRAIGAGPLATSVSNHKRFERVFPLFVLALIFIDFLAELI